MFTAGDTELFEIDCRDDSLYWLETEKTKEHESALTSVDFNPSAKLLLTADKEGKLRVWTRQKKFLREVQLPEQIDSAHFINTKGDILVSHQQTLSLLPYSNYYSKIFDYFDL